MTTPAIVPGMRVRYRREYASVKYGIVDYADPDLDFIVRCVTPEGVAHCTYADDDISPSEDLGTLVRVTDLEECK
jgi:hypothetical protein